jgi:2-polyprenyl-6-methoxyphenol hydroxylase-like FAD-dependent oxidoreductase
MAPKSEVLIVGAGPTGLVLALWQMHLGVRVRIVDKATEHRHHVAGPRRARPHS